MLCFHFYQHSSVQQCLTGHGQRPSPWCGSLWTGQKTVASHVQPVAARSTCSSPWTGKGQRKVGPGWLPGATRASCPLSGLRSTCLPGQGVCGGVGSGPVLSWSAREECRRPCSRGSLLPPPLPRSQGLRWAPGWTPRFQVSPSSAQVPRTLSCGFPESHRRLASSTEMSQAAGTSRR